MFKSITVLVTSCLMVSLYAKSASFIDPCKWNDKECLKKSSQKAIPYIADGVPEIGTSPVDPMNIDFITTNEGGLKLDWKDVKVVGLKQCQMTDIERNIEDHWLSFVMECPIDVTGQYSASGKISFVPLMGEGGFHIESDKVVFSVKLDVNIVDNHWKLSNIVHTYEFIEKAHLHFENLFNGDKEKASPILTIFDQQWKELVQSVGKPVVTEMVNRVYKELLIVLEKMPANELEI